MKLTGWAMMALLASAGTIDQAGAREATVSGPGVMIEKALLPAELSLPDASEGRRIMYSSTDGVTGQGEVQVSGAVFLPKGKRPAGGWPIVAWAHGTVGIGDTCAPSRNPRAPRDFEYLGKWLNAGFAVVATDYQGLGTPGMHPYLHARTQAYSVLDSVRAALRADLGLSNQVLIVGQSQGASAAFATAGEAARYAPELNIKGTVATGIPYLTPSRPRKTDPNEVDPGISYVIYIAVAAQATTPGERADKVLTPKAMALAAKAEEVCSRDMGRAVVAEGLTRGNALVAELEIGVPAYFKGMMYGTLAIPTPVFIGTGTKDTTILPEMQAALVRDACKAGTTVVHRSYEGEDHGSVVVPSLADSLPFARAVMTGGAIVGDCPTG